MCVVGSIGKLGVAPAIWKGANIARAICRIQPSDHIAKEYLVLLLRSKYMQELFSQDTRTLAQPTLNIGLVRHAITPVPSVDEQYRIVKKVNELLGVCDELKVKIRTAAEAELSLCDVLVDRALRY